MGRQGCLGKPGPPAQRRNADPVHRLRNISPKEQPMGEQHLCANSQSVIQNFKSLGRIECNLVLFFSSVFPRYLLLCDASTGYKVKQWQEFLSKKKEK